jgi:hypothetical protein
VLHWNRQWKGCLVQRTTLIAAAVIAASAAITTGSAAAGTARPGGYLDSQPANNLAAGVASRFEGFAADSTYAGVVIEETDVRVYVVGRPSPALQATLDRQAAVPIRITHVRTSLAELTSLTLRLNDDSAMLARQGIGMSSWGPDIFRDQVLITLSHYSGAQAAALRSRYGSALIHVETRSVQVSPD